VGWEVVNVFSQFGEFFHKQNGVLERTVAEETQQRKPR
jgi:hypothetical protein